jgi:hypothetical protein
MFRVLWVKNPSTKNTNTRGYTSVEVYLVMPDLSRAKVEALVRLSRELPVFILISYSTFKLKPVTLERLAELRRRAYVGVMLDSGAYHMARLGLHVDVSEYASFASRYDDLFDIVVAPDIPGDARATINRTVAFAKTYGGEMLPVVQGGSMEEYVWSYLELKKLGLVDGYAGVGGLDGVKRRKDWLKKLLSKLCYHSVRLHLFGVGARLSRSLATYSYCIKSLDSGAWQAEIRYRRRSQLRVDEDTVEANYRAMKKYLYRFNLSQLGLSPRTPTMLNFDN